MIKCTRHGAKCFEMQSHLFRTHIKKYEADEITRFTNKERIKYYEQTLISKNMCPILEIKLD